MKKETKRPMITVKNKVVSNRGRHLFLVSNHILRKILQPTNRGCFAQPGSCIRKEMYLKLLVLKQFRVQFSQIADSNKQIGNPEREIDQNQWKFSICRMSTQSERVDHFIKHQVSIIHLTIHYLNFYAATQLQDTQKSIDVLVV